MEQVGFSKKTAINSLPPPVVLIRYATHCNATVHPDATASLCRTPCAAALHSPMLILCRLPWDAQVIRSAMYGSLCVNRSARLPKSMPPCKLKAALASALMLQAADTARSRHVSIHISVVRYQVANGIVPFILCLHPVVCDCLSTRVIPKSKRGKRHYTHVINSCNQGDGQDANKILCRPLPCRPAGSPCSWSS